VWLILTLVTAEVCAPSTAKSGEIDVLGISDGTNGQGPNGSPVADAYGNLYGTSFAGGTSNQGTVGNT
jgi:hypothetical protein